MVHWLENGLLFTGLEEGFGSWVRRMVKVQRLDEGLWFTF
jgi:hypothetical protein